MWENGEVHPHKFIVSSSSPTVRKYDKEKYASNLEEELLLVEDLEKSLEWEENANDVMDGCYVDLLKERRIYDCTPRWIAAKEKLLKNAQLDVAKFAKMVADCETRIRDVDIVRTTEHKIRHAKFAAADALKVWINKNLNRLSFVCNVTISNTLATNPMFSSFVPVWRLARLPSERYTTLGTLKSNCVKEKGGCLGSFRKHL